MLSQVTFTADRTLKKLALTKAKNEGFPLKTVLIYALKGFVAGTVSFGLISNNSEQEIEPINFNDHALNLKASKLAKLLK